jgi:hypothetical protein
MVALLEQIITLGTEYSNKVVTIKKVRVLLGDSRSEGERITVSYGNKRGVFYVDSKLQLPVRYDGFVGERLVESYAYKNVNYTITSER